MLGILYMGRGDFLDIGAVTHEDIEIKAYLASRASAMMPAAMGAEADVPVWLSVHRCLRSVVI